MCAGDKYVAAGDERLKVGVAVAGDPAYDSPHDARNGLVRKSEKKSGLTRKKKP